MKNTRIFLIFGILAISILLTVFLYPHLPAEMVTHWGISGEADGYMSRFWGAWMLPIIMVGMLPIFYLLPSLDPLKKNWSSFQHLYWWFVTAFLGFFGYLQVLVLLYNVGSIENLTTWMLPALALFFMGIGMIMPGIGRNWFMGIRTPWTMSSDEVWSKTHDLGGKLFIVNGLLFLLPIWYPITGFMVAMAGIFATVVITFAYSYWLFKQNSSSN